MKKYLILSSIVFFFASCSQFYYDSLLKSNKDISSGEIDLILSPKVLVSSKYVMRMSALEREFSGIFVIREVDNNVYRLMLITHTGVTILSVEVAPDKFTVIYCLEQLNNKYFLNILNDDISTVLYLRSKYKSALIMKDVKSNSDVLRLDNDETQYYCFFDNQRKISRIDEVSGGDLKKKILFTLENDGSAKSIEIVHNDYPINLILERIVDE
jgi:hypothetical protein